MANEAQEFTWGGLTAKAVETLRAPKVHPVPAEIVALAQQSYDARDASGKDTLDGSGEPMHTRELTLKSDAMAEAFAKHLKNAGAHTNPPSTVRVVQDPLNNGNKRHVRWRAQKRLGRKAGSTTDGS